jgi:DNA-binding LacI/PurR family transcriptional regulator
MKAVDNTIEGGYLGAKKMIAENGPRAIFATSDEIAYGVMEAIKDAGLRIPEDVAVAGFGNSRMSNLVEPKLTTVELPFHKMGIYGARLLFDLIEDDNKGNDSPRQIMLQTKLRIRKSCGHKERIGEMF